MAGRLRALHGRQGRAQRHGLDDVGASIAQRDPSAVARWSALCARDIRMHKLTQFLFFEQWQRCATPAARGTS